MIQLLTTLAEDAFTYSSSSSSSGGAGIFGGVFLLLYLAVLVLVIAGMWRVFTKAGRPGWAAIIPIYNGWVMFEIAGKPGWWVLLALVPFVNIAGIVLAIIAYIELAKRFGKGGGTAALLILLPFIGWPMLGFGDAQYQGGEGGQALTFGAPASGAAPAAPQPPVAPAPVAPQAPVAPTPPVAPAAAPPAEPQDPQQPPVV